MTDADGERAPEHYIQSLFEPEPEPGFAAPGQLERVWGVRWGASDEVGRLRRVLLRRPGDEWRAVREASYDAQADALVDPARNWFWYGRRAPDVARMQSEHEGLVELLRAEGVRVELAPPVPAQLVNAVYVRDPMCTIRGGAIVGRMAPAMRRGEERHALQAVAALGMPVLHTIAGSGLLEGGTVCKLTPGVVAMGASRRCNLEAAQQLRDVLRPFGVELVVVPLGGWSIHLDGHLGMVDVDKALIDAPGLPYWFLDRLRELGIEALHRHPDEEWSINSLALRPGRIVMSEGSPRTVEMLVRRGIEVLTTPYDEIQRGGGGIHCTTMELERDDS